MTRGQISIIHEGFNGDTFDIVTSIEFNGDMYMPEGDWKGHGQEVVDLLKDVTDVANYQYVVAKFNNENHHYNDCVRLTYNIEGNEAKQMLDFTKDYFANWFSDYVYLKNITKETINIITEKRDKTGEVIEKITTPIKPNTIVVLCFGAINEIIEQQD